MLMFEIKGYLSGVAPKLALRFSPSDRLTAGKYAIPGPNRILVNASPMHWPFLLEIMKKSSCYNKFEE